jgi:hypothetical protein
LPISAVVMPVPEPGSAFGRNAVKAPCRQAVEIAGSLDAELRPHRQFACVPGR